MRIVLDTSILVRGNENSHGLGRELLLNIMESEHVLLLSSEMIYELARVLRYPRIRKFYSLSEDAAFEYVNAVRARSEIVTLDPLVFAPIRDVNDIVVMQTAIIGEADILCTQDDDFFEPPAFEYLDRMGIAVMADVTLMHRLRS